MCICIVQGEVCPRERGLCPAAGVPRIVTSRRSVDGDTDAAAHLRRLPARRFVLVVAAAVGNLWVSPGIVDYKGKRRLLLTNCDDAAVVCVDCELVARALLLRLRRPGDEDARSDLSTSMKKAQEHCVVVVGCVRSGCSRYVDDD